MRFIGDVHAKFSKYIGLLNCDQSIQVGDFGVGFASIPDISINHRFIRGNHDNPLMCGDYVNYIKDGTIEDDMFFCGGANSVDKHLRKVGIDWWEDEELSITEFMDIISLYENNKPKIMITHDCPKMVSQRMVSRVNPSRTGQAFDSMFELHQPDVWIYGHYHMSFDQIINGTRFICLNELEYIDI